jgi:hypothetical protein
MVRDLKNMHKFSLIVIIREGRLRSLESRLSECRGTK